MHLEFYKRPIIQSRALQALVIDAKAQWFDQMKPSGRIRCSFAPVAAQVLAILPVFGGISGSTNTICNAIFSPIYLVNDASCVSRIFSTHTIITNF